MKFSWFAALYFRNEFYKNKNNNNEFLKVLNNRNRLHKELIEKIKELDKVKHFKRIAKQSICGECTICLEDICSNNNINNINNINSIIDNSILLLKYKNHLNNFDPIILSCGHAYHHKCIAKWNTVSHILCPNCGY
tara:strand:+ start:174 stop:581 length:408 start_codon:yes stop_codon:yes gene_type:complete